MRVVAAFAFGYFRQTSRIREIEGDKAMDITTKFDIDDRVVITTGTHGYDPDTYGDVLTVDRIQTTHGTRGGHDDGVQYLVKFPSWPAKPHAWIDEDELQSEAEFENANQATFEQ